MSGTSGDGIDAAAVELEEVAGRPRVRLLGYLSQPYPDPVRNRLSRLFTDEATSSEICALDALIGELFADAAQELIHATGLDGHVTLCASHGHTAWHTPSDA